jgi:Domain of unknown function (DUF4124)
LYQVSVTGMLQAVCEVLPIGLVLLAFGVTAVIFMRLFLLGLLLVSMPVSVVAEAYKCTDAKGKVSYSGTPCETSQVQQKTFSTSGSAAPRRHTSAGQNEHVEDPTPAECRQLGGYYVAGEGCLNEAPRNRSPGVAPERVAEECRKSGMRYVPALNACAQ